MMFHAVVSNIAGGTGTAYRAVIARQAGHIQFLSIKLLFLFNPNQYQLNIAKETAPTGSKKYHQPLVL